MPNVTRMMEYQSRDMITTLRALLHLAESGRLRGIAFSIKTGPQRFQYGFMGDYWRNPHEALACMTRMEYKANQLISAQLGDPDTTHMPL